MERNAITSCNAPAAIGPYSPGIKMGGTVYLSGQLGIDPATGELRRGVAAQADQALANIKALLAEVGITMDHVVKVTVLLSDINDFATVNDVYARHFSKPYPARSAFQVGALPAGGLVEIEVIAAM